jgi:plasmid stability protein
VPVGWHMQEFTLICDTNNDVVTRNITFSLPVDLVRRAKIYAAEHDTTINSLVRELLQEKLTREGRAWAAAERLLAVAERGPYFKTDPSSIRREELYERS